MATSLGSPEFRGLTNPLPEVWRLHLKAALQTFRVKNVSLRAEGGYGRAKGTVRSKAEPWNEPRVKNANLGAKGDNESRRSWARQSSGALLIRIPKSGDIGCEST